MPQLLRISLLFAIAALPSFALAPFNISCQKGAQTVMTSAIPSSTRVQQSYAGATVTVFIHGGAVGVVSTSGTAVTWVSGTQFNANSDWNGIAITINSVSYTITTVTDATHLTLNSSAGTQTSVAYGIATAKAPIFSDYAGNTPQANPLTCSATAGFLVYSPNSIIDETFSGTGIAVPFTLSAAGGVDPLSTTTGLLTYNASIGTAAAQCTAAFNANQTLIVSQPMAGLATQAMNCATQFLQGGVIQPLSGQTVTLNQCPSAGSYRIFDFSLGGSVVLAGPCASQNASWYGLTGDGATDNAAAFGYALANCQSASGPNVRLAFPQGNYVIKSAVTVSSRGCWIDGENQSNTTLTLLPASSNTDGLIFNGAQYQSYNKLSNITIQAGNANVRYAEVIANQDRFWQENVQIEGYVVANVNTGMTNGIYFDGIQNTAINTTRVTNATGDCITWNASDASTSTKISHGYFGSCTGNGATVNANGDVTFDGNTFESNKAGGIDCGHTSVARCSINNNHFEAQATNPLVVGIAGTGKSSISELDMLYNETLQSADSSATPVLIQADHARIRGCNRYTYNPNVFTAGWIGGTANTVVESTCDPTAGFALNAFPFINGAVSYYGFGPMNTFKASALSVDSALQATLVLSPDFKNSPAGIYTVNASSSPLVVNAPVNAIGSQKLTIRVHNSRTAGNYVIAQFNAAYVLNLGNQNVTVQSGQDYLFNFIYDPFDSKWVLYSSEAPLAQGGVFAGLPPCSPTVFSADGLIRWITDANSNVWGDAVAGGGVNTVGVTCTAAGAYHVAAK